MSLGLIAKDSIQDLTSLGDESYTRKSFSPKRPSPKSVTVGYRRTASDTDAIRSKNSRIIGQGRYSYRDSKSDVVSTQYDSSVIDDEKPLIGSSFDGIDASSANPQQAPLSNVPYSGFRYDFSDYSDDYYDANQQHPNREQQRQRSSASQQHRLADGNNANAKATAIGQSTAVRADQGRKPNLLCCFFPWMGNNQDYSHRHSPLDIFVDGPQDFVESIEGTADIDAEIHNHDSVESKSHTRDAKNISFESDEADSCSTSSHNKLGEKLSERERQAVLARLRLASPESSNSLRESERGTSGGTASSEALGPSSLPDQPTNGSSIPTTNGSLSKQHESGLLNGIPVFDMSPLIVNRQPRSILKRRSTNNMDTIIIMKNGVITSSTDTTKMLERANSIIGDPLGDSMKSPSVNQSSAQRRSLFPSYEKCSRKPRENIKPVRFSPMARVVPVTSRNDLEPEEKADVWWQRSDYEDFRRTGRIITRAMVEGGSEIWLNSSASEPSKNPSTDNNFKSIAKCNEDKWWHKFGHSRRGLEHVVSVDEGKQRQLNVRSAIRAVLDEQARQTLYRRTSTAPSTSNVSFEEKLRSVSMHHTQWARDLSLAAGASDADAVESSFAEDRRSREFYLLKLAKNETSSQINGNSLSADVSNKSNQHLVPQFMQPTMQAARDATRQMQQRLDANTTNQIRFRNKLGNDSNKSTKIDLQSQLSTKASMITKASNVKKVVDQEKANSESINKQDDKLNSTSDDADDKSNQENPAHDGIKCEPLKETKDVDKQNSTTLAQKAAGFSSVDAEKVNMAVVLSGMGVL